MDKKQKMSSEEVGNQLIFILSLFAYVIIIMAVSAFAGVGLFFMTGDMIRGMMFSSFATLILLMLCNLPFKINKNEKKTTRSNNRRRR